MNRTDRIAIGLGLISAVAIMATLLVRRPQPQIQRLPDGSTLRLTKVEFGATNEFYHGSALEKSLTRLLPAKGVQVGRLSLSPPQKLTLRESASSLAAEFRSDRAGGASSVQLGRSRWVIQGDDPMRYVASIQAPPFGEERDGTFTYLITSRFPRRSRQLLVTLENREREDADWHEVARFKLKNPSVAHIQPWTAEPSPITKRVGEMEFTLGEVIVKMEPLNTNNIWPCTVRVPFRVTSSGIVQTNWNADDTDFEDASGNGSWMLWAGPKSVDNGWLVFKAIWSLDPGLVWKIQANLALDSGWAPGEILSVPIPAFPAPTLQTNFNGVPLEIALHNPSGQLKVRLLTNRTDLRLTLIDLKDQVGKRPQIRWGGSFQHGFYYGPIAGGTVTFAVHRNYQVDFYVKPSWVKAGASNGSSGR